MVVKLVCVSAYTSSSGIKKKKKIIMLFRLWISLMWVYYVLCSWYLDIWHVDFFICLSATPCSRCCFYWMQQLIADPHRRLILMWCPVSRRCLVKWVITWQKVYFNVWKNFWRNAILDPWIRCSGCKCYSTCTCSISIRRSISLAYCFIKATNY